MTAYKTPHKELRSPSYDTPIGYKCRRNPKNTGFISRAPNVCRWLSLGKENFQRECPVKDKPIDPKRKEFKVRIKNGKILWIVDESNKRQKHPSIAFLGLNGKADGIYTV